MKRWFNRKTGLVLGLIILAIVVAGGLFFKPLMNTWMNSLVRAAMSKKNVQYEDGIYAGLCGTGSPMPDINRAGPCISVLAGGHAFIVDAGEGSTRNVSLMNFPIGKTEAILLTHFHSDHISDLGEMELQRWAGGVNQTPVTVIGPRELNKSSKVLIWLINLMLVTAWRTTAQRSCLLPARVPLRVHLNSPPNTTPRS